MRSTWADHSGRTSTPRAPRSSGWCRRSTSTGSSPSATPPANAPRSRCFHIASGRWPLSSRRASSTSSSPPHGLQRRIRRGPSLPRPGARGMTTAFVICGALGKEVKDIVDRRGWDVDIYGVSALLHLYPNRIVEELREKLHELRPRYEHLVVVYGDCGMNGKLEPILDEVGASRVRDPHCYEMLAGADLFQRVSEERPATFFLTDWLVRNFERAVVRGLGLDRDPELREMLFGNYEALLYLRQVPNPRLADKAAEIAAYLGLPLEINDVGLGELEERLAELVEVRTDLVQV